ncbi:MAG: PD40 domain-containing protein [Chloroflexi bacterium]|nr:PD40 domain-containing protein [Chloroflexota bacterium]
MSRFKLGILILFLIGGVFVPAAFAAGPTGSSPNDPMMVPTDSQSIAPNSTLWFYFDYVTERIQEGRGSTRARANVAVDANGISGLQLAIYTPSQANDWLSDPTTEPTGFGTPYIDRMTQVLVHDLYWLGGFNVSGRYLVAVTNANTAPVTFRLTITGNTVTLYPTPTPASKPTLFIPVTVTPPPTGTVQGKIVFETATGGAIYTVNGDGSNLTRVSQGIEPSWSPDGKQITFARWDNVLPGIYIANADGSDERRILGAPRVRWPRFSPDGKFIVFAQEKTKTDNNPIWKLGLVEIATGNLTEPQCTQLCFMPSWNSDSVTVTYADPGFGIMGTSILSGPPSLILGPTGSYWDTAANIPRPILHMPPIQSAAVSPDGKRIIYSQPAHDRYELNLVYADGTNPMAVTSPDPILYYLLGVAVHNVSPAWSPSGNEIMFLADRNGKWEFFVVNPDGSNLRQVLKNVTDLITIRYDFSNERMLDWAK